MDLWKKIAGRSGHNKLVHCVKTDKKVKIDNKHGNLCNTNQTELKVGFDNGLLLPLGVALVILPDRTYDGKWFQ